MSKETSDSEAFDKPASMDNIHARKVALMMRKWK